MHPRLAELLDHLDRERTALEAAVGRVPPALRDVRPAADAWSVAEVLDHLAIVESGVARLLAKRIAAARAAGLEPERETSSVLGALDHLMAGGVADSPVRREAPELVRPRPDADANAALSALGESRAALRETLLDADGLALGRVTAAHRLLGELDAYQWVLFVAQHERRHARQIGRIAEELATAGVPLAPPPA